MALNYAIGVFVYRSYVTLLKESSITCTLTKVGDNISGSIVVQTRRGLKLIPIDFQIYFYNQEGKLVQSYADSFKGSQHVEFTFKSTMDAQDVKGLTVTGVSNVRVKWLWISDLLPLSIEVRGP